MRPIANLMLGQVRVASKSSAGAIDMYITYMGICSPWSAICQII